MTLRYREHFKTLSSSIPQGLLSLLYKKGFDGKNIAIVTGWNNIVGSDIATNYTPFRLIKYSNGFADKCDVLEVLVENSGYLQRLPYYKDQIEDKIQNFIGRKITIRGVNK